MVGMSVTITGINENAGSIAQTLRINFENAVHFNQWLLDHPPIGGVDPLVVPLGMTAEDAAILRGAMADLAYMKAAAFDSSPNVRKLWGIG